jgi:hypothetical protein
MDIAQIAATVGAAVGAAASAWWGTRHVKKAAKDVAHELKGDEQEGESRTLRTTVEFIANTVAVTDRRVAELSERQSMHDRRIRDLEVSIERRHRAR